MPVAADIAFNYSGGAANTSPAASLGGARSTAAGGVIDEDIAFDLFDVVTGTQRAAGYTDYRAIYLVNGHATQTAFASTLYVSTPANTEFDVALATEAVNTAIANTIATEETAPTAAWLAAAFSHPSTDAGGLAIGDIPALGFKGLWIRRIIPPGSTSITPDRVGISLSFDSD